MPKGKASSVKLTAPVEDGILSGKRTPWKRCVFSYLLVLKPLTPERNSSNINVEIEVGTSVVSVIRQVKLSILSFPSSAVLLQELKSMLNLNYMGVHEHTEA